MNCLETMNTILMIAFLVCYAYQFFYILVPHIKKDKPHKQAKLHRYAVLICARNEEAVIADLIDSLHGQTYPQDKLKIFVMADNCTDRTADAARAAGATVYERFDREKVGKGYALDALLGHIAQDEPEGFDGYFVFDADNLLRPDYIERMNETFSDGHDIVTSYRNSKNYGDNWISAGYGLWFLRESEYLNHARMLLGTSCAVSGTGFLFSRKVLRERLALPSADRGHSVLRFPHSGRLQDRLLPAGRAVRRAARDLPPVVAAADALVARLSSGAAALWIKTLRGDVQRQLLVL